MENNQKLLTPIQFYTEKFDDNKYNVELYGKNKVSALKRYFKHIRKHNTLASYLEYLQGREIDRRTLHQLMEEVAIRALENRTSPRYEFMLYSIQKHYQVTLPSVHGIATQRYWEHLTQAMTA